METDLNFSSSTCHYSFIVNETSKFNETSKLCTCTEKISIVSRHSQYSLVGVQSTVWNMTQCSVFHDPVDHVPQYFNTFPVQGKVMAHN